MLRKLFYFGGLPAFLTILWVVFDFVYVITVLVTGDAARMPVLVMGIVILVYSLALSIYLATTAIRITDGFHALLRITLDDGSSPSNNLYEDIKKIEQAVKTDRLGSERVISLVQENARNVLASSEQVSLASHQAEMATNQIATTIQQVASGSSETSQSVEKTASTVQIMATILSRMSAGIQSQANAVNQASQVIEKITGKDGISAKVGISAQKVREMVDQSEKINSIVDTVSDFSFQTNLLAINAAIETTHAETQSVNLPEIILNRMMVSQARLLNQVLCMSGIKFTTSFWADLAERCNIDTICITDKTGAIVYTNDKNILGWKFPDDPKSQAYEFRALISQKDGFVCQKPQKRSFDDRTFKYVGVSRADEPGIVQVAFDVDTLAKFRVQLGGFKVVSDEVRKLAGKSKEATNQITDIVKAMRVQIDALAKLTEAVFNEMDIASSDLSNVINLVSRVVTENQQAISGLETSSSNIMTMVDNIAAVSEENCASSEEVSASAEEMNAQVEELSASARALREMALVLLKVVEESNNINNGSVR